MSNALIMCKGGSIFADQIAHIRVSFPIPEIGEDGYDIYIYPKGGHPPIIFREGQTEKECDKSMDTLNLLLMETMRGETINVT